MVHPADHRDDEQHQNDGSAVHPVDEDEDQDGRPTEPPELPDDEGEKAPQGLCRAEPHVPVRGEHGRRHGNADLRD